MTNNPQSEYMQGVYCPACNKIHTNFVQTGDAEPTKTTVTTTQPCPTCGITHFPAWNDKGECIKCARDRIRDAPEAPQIDELDEFLGGLKVHHKDVDTCFNDAVAKAYLDKLILAKSTRDKNEARKQELGRLSQLAKRHPNFVALANTIDNRLKELEETNG